MRRLVIYKLELICVKYVPIIIALLSLLDNVLMYYDISLDILSYIAGTSQGKLIIKGKLSCPLFFFFTYPKYK